MSRQGIDSTMSAGKTNYNLFYRFLRLFTDIRQGEASKALLLALNVFLILMAYYIIKPVRDALILSAKSPEMKSYLGAAQAILLIFVVKAFSRLASRVPRHLLITWVTLFFISNLIIFNLLELFGVPVGTIGIIFYIWIGIFNLMVVAQFWGFANDLYTEDIGKRVFPLVAFGATLGAPLGSKINTWFIQSLGLYRVMLVSAAVLGVCIILAILIHRSELRRLSAKQGLSAPDQEQQKKIQEEPLQRGGGFRLVFKSRYLLLIAVVVGLYNFINANGEYMIGRVVSGIAAKAVELGATGGLDKGQYIDKFFAEYQFLQSVLAIIIQLFLVSRIFKWVGIGGALLFLPFVALGGYGIIAFGATILLLKWVKSLENGTDYSLQKTTMAALFLKTSREEKYKAKAAIDTFFWRGGDTLSAFAVFLGTTYLAASVEGYAGLNVVCVVAWIVLSVLIAKEYKKIKVLEQTK
jgi:AAA family ATP:ADP antiporter